MSRVKRPVIETLSTFGYICSRRRTTLFHRNFSLLISCFQRTLPVQCFIGNSHNAHSLHTSPYNNTAGRVFFHPRKDLRRVGGRLPEGRAPISVQTSRLAFVRATYLPAGVGGNEAETPGPKY